MSLYPVVQVGLKLILLCILVPQYLLWPNSVLTAAPWTSDNFEDTVDLPSVVCFLFSHTLPEWRYMFCMWFMWCDSQLEGSKWLSGSQWQKETFLEKHTQVRGLKGGARGMSLSWSLLLIFYKILSIRSFILNDEWISPLISCLAEFLVLLSVLTVSQTRAGQSVYFLLWIYASTLVP